MTKLYYYFLRNSLDDSISSDPYVTTDKLGGIGDFVEIDGQGYYIEDVAIEDYETESEYEGESLYW